MDRMKKLQNLYVKFAFLKKYKGCVSRGSSKYVMEQG